MVPFHLHTWWLQSSEVICLNKYNHIEIDYENIAVNTAALWNTFLCQYVNNTLDSTSLTACYAEIFGLLCIYFDIVEYWSDIFKILTFCCGGLQSDNTTGRTSFLFVHLFLLFNNRVVASASSKQLLTWRKTNKSIHSSLSVWKNIAEDDLAKTLRIFKLKLT